MSPKRRSIVLTTCSVLAAALVPLAIAWACSPQAFITVSTPAGATPRSPVTVTGHAFLARPVEISIAGETVTTVEGPSFRTSVTIPELRPGVYYVRAVARDAEGDIAGQPAQPIEVVAPAADAAPPAGASPSPSEAPPVPSAGPEASGSESSAAPSVSTPDRTAAAQKTKTGASPDSSGPARRAARNRSAGTRAAAPRAGSRSPSMQAPAVRTESGRTVFAGSVASPAGRETASAGRDRTTVDSPPRRSAEPPGERSRRPTGASILPSPSDPQMQPGRPGAVLAIGAGLLGLGLVAVLAGFLVAEVRRRRATVDAARSQR